MRKTTKIYKIEVQSDLAPFHNQVMEDAMIACLKGLQHYWKNKSVKKFEITLSGKNIIHATPNFE